MRPHGSHIPKTTTAFTETFVSMIANMLAIIFLLKLICEVFALT